MHLVDHARSYIEQNYKRPWHDRLLRWVLSKILPYPTRFRIALLLAKIGRPFRGLVPDARLRAMLEMAPKKIPPVSRNDDVQVFRAAGETKMRVALMTGCAQKALNTDINDATIRVLTRHGAEVVIVKQGCCGALTHHMGKAEESHTAAARNIAAFVAEDAARGLDAIVINTSGCGTTVKDYGHMFKENALAKDAARVAELACDVTEILANLTLKPTHKPNLRVAYHAACSLQHGQKVTDAPKDVLRALGLKVLTPENPHLCCGSAGTYNLLQPDISAQLRDRKVATLEDKSPDVIAAGNLGCMMQIGTKAKAPIVHTVELADWITGGPCPPALDTQS